MSGIPDGLTPLKSFARGIYEGQAPTYRGEEELIFEASNDIKKLISDLEKAEIQINENET